jgi:hypothetical protein
MAAVIACGIRDQNFGQILCYWNNARLNGFRQPRILLICQYVFNLKSHPSLEQQSARPSVPDPRHWDANDPADLLRPLRQRG